MLLLEVFKALNELKVRYLVVGGVAGVFYGNPRFTKDLDILVDLKEANLTRLVKAFKALRFVPRVPVKAEALILEENRKRWIQEKGMLAFTFINPADPFDNTDIMIVSPVPFGKAYRRRKIFKVEGISVPMASLKDLIFMKKKAGRPQDLQDVDILEAVSKIKKSGP